MNGKSKKIIVNPIAECDGCQKCVEACANVMGLDTANNGNSSAGEKTLTGIKISTSGDFHVPVLCRNCTEAPCMTACMTGCISQDEKGLVITDQDRCVGCWMCVMNCPFGAIERAERNHVAVKCNGCMDMEVAPCVAACEPGVITQIEIAAFTDNRRKSFAKQYIRGVNTRAKV